MINLYRPFLSHLFFYFIFKKLLYNKWLKLGDIVYSSSDDVMMRLPYKSSYDGILQQNMTPGDKNGPS